MGQKDLIELLANHADHLLHSEGGDAQEAQVSPEHQDDVNVLLQLAEQVKGALVPVKPSPAFKRQLGGELTEVAQRRRSKDLLIEPRPSRRELIIGAAIGSAVALAGGIVYLVRSHIQDRSRPVSRVQP